MSSAITPAHSSHSATATGRLPDFVIIGAMKSGTTTLFEYLQRHPQIFMCSPKEPAFFSRDDIYERGLDWYRGLFAGARSDQLCGEASTCYTRSASHPRAAERLIKTLPGARLVYLLRHPVERSYSHYVHAMSRRLVRTGQGPIPLDEALQTMPSIVQSSRYIDEIERYLGLIPREQLCVLTLDELRADPVATLATVQAHLGVAQRDLVAAGALVSNQSANAVADLYARRRIGALRNSLVGRVLAPLVPRGIKTKLSAWFRQTLRRSRAATRERAAFKDHVDALTEPQRVRLHEQLDDATVRLERFLARDLAHWRHPHVRGAATA